MRSLTSFRAGLMVALMLATGMVTDAQTNWPTATTAKTATATASKPVKSRKPAPKRRRKAVRPRPVATVTPNEIELLRSMADLITRQAAAIELLARRLEATEARLATVTAAQAHPPAVATIEDAQAPFRASLSLDWSKLLSH
jgi:hypothetical protein